MHITLETDYAVRIIDTLGKAQERMSAQEIAEKAYVTLSFALKILRKLVHAGLVRSYKGAQGGYEINKPLNEISLYDIVETIEGPYMLNRCLAEGHVCIRNHDDDPCPYHLAFEALSEDVTQKLKAATMDQFVEK